MDEREKNLPKWAQQLLMDLRQRVQSATEPLSKELAILRPKVELLKRRNDGLRELLDCAAKGGHVNASEIVDLLLGYELQLLPKEE